MEEFFASVVDTAATTLFDVMPIVAVLLVFQVLVLRRKLPNLRRILVGFALVLAGLTLFLIGLQEALFPIGETMARQLTSPAAIGVERLADGVQCRTICWSMPSPPPSALPPQWRSPP